MQADISVNRNQSGEGKRQTQTIIGKACKQSEKGMCTATMSRGSQLLTGYDKCLVMSVLIFNEEKWLKDSALFSNSQKLSHSCWGKWKRINLLFISFLPYEVISLRANSRLCNWYVLFWSLCIPLVKCSISMVGNVLSPSDWSCFILERTGVKCDFVSEYNVAYFNEYK